MYAAHLIRLTAVVLVATFFGACEGDPVVPPKPPVIDSAQVICEDDDGSDYPLVAEVSVRIADEDRDLVASSLRASLNGLLIGLRDDDGDEVYSFSPGGDWNPPLICKGEFTLLVWATDLAGNQVKETLVVDKS